MFINNIEAMQQSAEVITIDSKRTMPLPLSVHVKKTVELYFSQLNGHDTSGLHAMVISEVEKPLIESALEYCGHNQTKASKILGLSRSTLRKKIELYDLS
ncbi:MAG: Fis family transcriptional regulator [Methylococcales bacterium]|nr:Fis family transcriptional regulator [Methylococcales bacterium]MCK5478187.1 Fis family transcriptional regulator [Methylococcales bacterium]